MQKWYVLSVYLLAVCCVVLLSACEDKIDPIDPGGNGGDGLPDNVTYTQHVKPVLDQYCAFCHGTGVTGAARQGAPPGIDMDTYDTAVATSERSNVRIQAGTMPPAGPLTAYDRDLFQKWVDQGTQE